MFAFWTSWFFRGYCPLLAELIVVLDIRRQGGILCALSKLRDFGFGLACGGDCTFARYWGASGCEGEDTALMTHPPSSLLASLQQTRPSNGGFLFARKQHNKAAQTTAGLPLSCYSCPPSRRVWPWSFGLLVIAGASFAHVTAVVALSADVFSRVL